MQCLENEWPSFWVPEFHGWNFEMCLNKNWTLQKYKLSFIRHWMSLLNNISRCHLGSSSCFFVYQMSCPDMRLFRWLWTGMEYPVNTLSPEQNGGHFADDTSTCIFLNGKDSICIFYFETLRKTNKQTNKQTDGCLALVGYPWLRKILVENIPLAKPFTIFWSWAYSYLSFRIFSWNKSIPSTVGKRNFSKTEIDLAPKCLFGGWWWGVAEIFPSSENRQWFSSKMPIFGFLFKPHFLFTFISTEGNTTRWHLRIWLVKHTRRASFHQADGRHVTAVNLPKSRSHEIGCYSDRIAVKFDRHYGSATFQNSERLEKFKPKSLGLELHRIFPNT